MKNYIYTTNISILLIGILWVLLMVPLTSFAAEKNGATEASSLTPEKLASLEIKQPLFSYESLSRPDPFRPFIDFSQIERSIPTDASKDLTPLEKYALNQFKLVGIIMAGENHNYALVEDPEQIGYTVREGDKIGDLSGYVKEINSNEVIVEEPYLDIFDKQQIRAISLKLRELEEDSYLSPKN